MLAPSSLARTRAYRAETQSWRSRCREAGAGIRRTARIESSSSQRGAGAALRLAGSDMACRAPSLSTTEERVGSGPKGRCTYRACGLGPKGRCSSAPHRGSARIVPRPFPVVSATEERVGSGPKGRCTFAPHRGSARSVPRPFPVVSAGLKSVELHRVGCCLARRSPRGPSIGEYGFPWPDSAEPVCVFMGQHGAR
jgi:hypothetical protein